MTQTILPTPHQYDITIIGAGMVGLMLACSLAKSPLRIAVMDAHHPPEAIPETTDIRVSAITLASQHLLEKVGAWSTIPAAKISPFRKMHVSDTLGNSFIDFDSYDINEPVLGYIIENRVLQAVLFQQLKTHANIDFICPAVLKKLNIKEEEVSLEIEECEVAKEGINSEPLSNQMIIKTKLLIGADGAKSKVRELANISITQRDYKQSALVANVRTELPHQKTARQRFLATGPLAFLPLSDPHWCSIVWSTLPAEAENLLTLSDEDFKIKLADAFGFSLGKIETVSQRAIFPLRMQHANNYIKPHLALVGDAAHTIHPLAGQGVNLGFQDTAVLTETILSALEKKQAINSWQTLRRYERWRKSDNTLMISFVAMINQMFTSNAPAIRTLANIGLNFTNKITLFKRFFMQHATKKGT